MPQISYLLLRTPPTLCCSYVPTKFYLLRALPDEARIEIQDEARPSSGSHPQAYVTRLQKQRIHLFTSVLGRVAQYCTV